MFTINSGTCIFQVSEEKRCQTFSFIYLIICVDSQPGLVPISLSDKKKSSTKKHLLDNCSPSVCDSRVKHKSVHLPKVFLILLQYVISSKLKLYLLHFHKCQYNIMYIEKGEDWIFSWEMATSLQEGREPSTSEKQRNQLMINWTSPKSSFMSLARVKLSILYC